MKPGNTVFYTSCNQEYFTYAMTSLLSIREYIPNARLHVLCRFLSIKQKELLKKQNITFTEIDLAEEYSKVWEYPLECYYMFYGPEQFYKEGFKYAVYIDSDVLCLKNPLLKKAPKGVSGVNVGKIKEVLGNDAQEIKKIFKINTEIERKRIQSGVVYFNTEAMFKIKLFESSVEMYKVCLEKDVPRKGDDSLFAILQAKYVHEDDIVFLKDKFNYIYQIRDESNINDVVFFHFTNVPKPWSGTIKQEYKSIYNKWRKINRKIKEDLKANDRIVKICQEIYRISSGQRLGVLTRRINSYKTPLKLFWYREPENDIYNFGDEFSSFLIPYLTGRRVEWSPVAECEMVGIGSLMEMILLNSKQEVKTWCSSFIEYGEDKKLPANIHPLATRGKNSAKRMKLDNIPIGDAGLFASLCFPKDEKKYTGKIGIIPHYIDLNNPIILEARKDPKYLVISPLDSPYEISQQIASCKCILSSSLHGLIFADSYSVPNIHLVLSNKVIGGSYKFIDYYTGINKTYKNIPISKVFDERAIQKVIKNYRPIDNLSGIRRNLLRALSVEV